MVELFLASAYSFESVACVLIFVLVFIVSLINMLKHLHIERLLLSYSENGKLNWKVNVHTEFNRFQMHCIDKYNITKYRMQWKLLVATGNASSHHLLLCIIEIILQCCHHCKGPFCDPQQWKVKPGTKNTLEICLWFQCKTYFYQC